MAIVYKTDKYGNKVHGDFVNGDSSIPSGRIITIYNTENNEQIAKGGIDLLYYELKKRVQRTKNLELERLYQVQIALIDELYKTYNTYPLPDPLSTTLTNQQLFERRASYSLRGNIWNYKTKQYEKVLYPIIGMGYITNQGEMRTKAWKNRKTYDGSGPITTNISDWEIQEVNYRESDPQYPVLLPEAELLKTYGYTSGLFLNIAPTDFKVKVGETKYIQLESNADELTVEINNQELIDVAIYDRAIKGIKEGMAMVTYIAKDTIFNIEKRVNVNVEVVAQGEKTKPIRIMLHNRNTNRLTTLSGNLDALNDVTYKLPSKNTKANLMTSENMYNKFSLIGKPSIISPKYATFDYSGLVRSSPYVTTIKFSGAHTKSVWQYALDIEFKKILFERERFANMNYFKDPDYLTKASTKFSDMTIYIRVKYCSDNVESQWSDPVKIHLRNTGYESYNQERLKGSNGYEGSYFGRITQGLCLNDRYFRGTYSTIIAQPTNYVKQMKIGYQVLHNNKLWVAQRAMDNTNIVEPGTNINSWLEDVRTNLPTIDWVMSRIGIGFGGKDKNLDGMSIGNESLGSKVNSNEDWIKYVYRGRLCYTPIKPICLQIAWTDIVKREATHGDRTFRHGDMLYRIRLLTEEEYRNIIVAMVDGRFATLDPYLDMSLNISVWLEDFREGPERKTATYNSNTKEVVISNLDPKSRTIGYRFVIEAIQEEDEPYKNFIHTGAIAVSKKIPNQEQRTNDFFYDYYTDTGYFGVIYEGGFMTRAYVDNYADTGFGINNDQYNDQKFLKFYWHGKILFFTTMPWKRYFMCDEQFNRNIMYGYDMGNNKNPLIPFEGHDYRIGNFITGRASPFNTGAKVLSNYGNTRYIEQRHIDANYSGFSQYAECLDRIVVLYEDGGERNWFWHSNAWPLRGCFNGLQIGDNFIPDNECWTKYELGYDPAFDSLGNEPDGRCYYDINDTDSPERLFNMGILGNIYYAVIQLYNVGSFETAGRNAGGAWKPIFWTTDSVKY